MLSVGSIVGTTVGTADVGAIDGGGVGSFVGDAVGDKISQQDFLHIVANSWSEQGSLEPPLSFQYRRKEA